MGRPNIFKYATRELSQDAMICWFLECLRSENKIYKDIGVEFIKFILEREDITENDIVLYVDSLKAQYYHMDVYAVVCVNNEAIPLIFEDKTNTYLHGDQMERYSKMVVNWEDGEYLKEIETDIKSLQLNWGAVRYIYFKTGYVFEWQKRDFEIRKKKLETECNGKLIVRNPIYVYELEKFLKRLPDEPLLNDYKEHISKVREKNEYSNAAKWDRIITQVFDSTVKFNYSYQGWSSKDIVHIDKGNSLHNIYYTIRCGHWKKGDAIALQQYRNEKNIQGNKDALQAERMQNAEEIKDICRDVFKELGVYSFDDCVENPESLHSQNNIFKIFFSEDEEEKVCKFFRQFIPKFAERVTDQYNAVDNR